jgi:hypothetical protein
MIHQKKKQLSTSGEWPGDGKEDSTKYSLKAVFNQDDKGNLKGYFLWNDEYGGHAKENLKGTINSKGNIILIYIIDSSFQLCITCSVVTQWYI